jgi:hypothetical protein
VFGAGTTGGVMFIGEGPGLEEEQTGDPAVGASGALLRQVLAKLGLESYYITNIVACRSCAVQLDEKQQPIFRKNWQTKQMGLVYKDEPPTPPQYNACLARLYEEIYLVDPTVIVGLGGKVVEALTRRPATITRDRGEPTQIEIPGASWRAKLTDKKQSWLRRSKEGTFAPVEQNTVRYYFLPTLPPSYVIRKFADRAPDSPFYLFLNDLRTAIRTHEVHQELVHGVLPTTEMRTDDQIIHNELQFQGE